MPTEKLRQVSTAVYCIPNIYLLWLWALKEFWMARLSLLYVPREDPQALHLPRLQLWWSKNINKYHFSNECRTVNPPRTKLLQQYFQIHFKIAFSRRYFHLCKLNCISLYCETPMNCFKYQMLMSNLTPRNISNHRRLGDLQRLIYRSRAIKLYKHESKQQKKGKQSHKLYSQIFLKLKSITTKRGHFNGSVIYLLQ